MQSKLFLSILPLFVILIAFQTNSNAEAITITNQTGHTYYLSKSPMIGIQLSPTCLILIKNHMKTDCPTYDKLKPLDNTNPEWAGQWVNTTYYHRELPRVSNHYLMNTNPFIVMVDPDPNFTTIAKMIIIQSGNFTYINPYESVGNNHTRNEYNNRFVSGCTTATVAPILSLIEDTVHYIESSCKITSYNEKVSVKTNDTPFDYNNPYSSLHLENYLKSLMHGHGSSVGNHTAGGLGLNNCINYKCDIKDPYAKASWKH